MLLQVQVVKGILDGMVMSEHEATKFNHVARLQTNETNTAKICLVDVANEFD